MQQGNNRQAPQDHPRGREAADQARQASPALPGPGPLAPVRRLLALTLGDERFALDIGVVREVLDFGDLTRIPRMPRHVRGVVNLRGAAVPVVDLRTRLGMGSVARTVHSRIVIVEVPAPPDAGGGITLVGALADAVREVIEIDAVAVEPPPRMGTPVPADVLAGIFRHEGRHMLLLDADRLFDDEEPSGAPAPIPPQSPSPSQARNPSRPLADGPPADGQPHARPARAHGTPGTSARVGGGGA
ncbi:MAG: chemotaxis protein CheW [Desulfovibrio sp.]|nr:chemotaxis protein CheW [Desulfovibrio sp.]